MTDDAPDTRQRILTTATQLFVHHGYHGLSMREIAESLNVTKAALYYHFKDKQALFMAVLEHNLADMSQRLRLIRATEPIASRQLEAFIDQFLSLTAEQRAVIRLAVQEINQVEEQERQRFSAIYHRDFVGLLEAVLEEGARHGEFRRINPRVAAMALLGILYPYMDVNRGYAPVDPSIRAELTLIFLRGIHS